MNELLKTLEQAKSIINALSLEDICFSEELSYDQTIASERELKALWRTFYDSTTLLSNQINQSWALPVLIQVIGEVYYGQYKDAEEKEWIGPAAKASLPFVWKNNYEAQKEGKDITVLKQLIFQCHMMEQLANMHAYFNFLPEQAAEYRRGQLAHHKKNIPFILATNQAMIGKGTRLRVSDENTQLMCDGIEFRKAIEAVLLDTQPADIPLLRDTFYAYIPSSKKRFWRALWTRVFMFCYVVSLSSTAENILANAIIIPKHGFPVIEEFTSQQHMESMFWQRPWLERQTRDAAVPMLNIAVERPILRIHKQGFFATSLTLLGDSINNFVESQIFRLPGREMGIDLPDSVRKKSLHR